MPSHPAVFHADLSDVRDDVRYFIAAGGQLHPLEPHTAASRARARAEAPHLAAIPDARLTHYTPQPVAMSRQAAVRVHVAYRDADGRRPRSGPHTGHAAIYLPPCDGEPGGGRTRHQHVDWISTAKTFLFHHADLRVKDPKVACIVHEHMDENRARATYALIEDLATLMREKGEPTEGADGWAQLEPVTYHGQTHYLHQPRQVILDAARPALKALMLSTKNDDRLKDKKWQQLPGVSTQTLRPQRLGTLVSDGSWTASVASDFYVNGVKTSVEVEDPAQRIVRVEMENIFVRYLAAYIQFVDAKGKPLETPKWTPEDGLPWWLTELEKSQSNLQEADFRFLGTIDPIDTILAVPDPLVPGRLLGNGTGWGVRVRFPQGATSAGIYGCGLGTGAKPHPGSCAYGTVFTILVNLIAPAIMMAFDVASNRSKTLYDAIQKLLAGTAKKVVLGILYAIEKLGLFVYSVTQGHPDWTKIVDLAKIAFGKGFEWFLGVVETELGEDAAEKVAEQIPFAGWIVSAISIASDIAQMAETVIEVISSPWQIPNSVHTEIKSTVHLRPDPGHGAFPTAAKGEKATWSVSMVHKSGGPTRVWPGEVPNPPPQEISFEFRNPLGDEVKLEATYSIDGQLRGKATTGWLPNDAPHTTTIPLVLAETAAPLTAKSVYRPASRFGYKGGAYAWIATDQAPDAVYKPDTRQTGNAISEWNGLALSQRRHRLGWAWKAAGTGLADCAGGGDRERQYHALTTAGVPGALVGAVLSTCGFAGRSNLVFDPFPLQFLMKDGRWALDPDGRPVPDPAAHDLGTYYVDPRKAGAALEKGGGYHLRSFDVGRAIDPGKGGLKSCGRFRYAPESLAIHPAGHVVGLSHEFYKIQVTPLTQGGAPDDQVPVGRVYSGQGIDFNGSGGRAGLLVQPIAVACTYDGTVLILENLRSEAFTLARVQAFDVHGNPVQWFRDARGKPSPFLELPAAGRTWLDLSVAGGEHKSYLFALYYEGKGTRAADYHVAVYQTGDPKPADQPLLTTGAFAAGRIAADMWNTLYALDYAMTADAAGHPAGAAGAGTGPAGRTVPSISAWVPRTAS